MLKIGDFSRLSQVTIQALRHYDELGLLKPAVVDPFTGYRYYTAAQLPRLNRILALKDLGFSLDQIGAVLEAGVTPEQLRGLLRDKQAEIEQRVRVDQERLARVAARLSAIEHEDRLGDYDVLLKPVAAQWVASVRATLPTHAHIGGLYGEVYDHLAAHGQAPGVAVALWHDEGHKETDVDGEAGFYLARPVPAVGRLRVYQLPAGSVISVIHHGAISQFWEAYRALFRWVGASGYRLAGPGRELYLHLARPVNRDDPASVTEIQFPVAKA